MTTMTLEAPYETFLLNQKENGQMTDYDELYELIMMKEDDDVILNKIEELSLRGLDEFYSKSVRMLVAGMSHEMKSPLQTVMGALEIMTDVLESDDDIDKDLLKQCIAISKDARVRIDNIMSVMALCGKELNENDIQCVNFKDLVYKILSPVKYREDYKTSPIEIAFKSVCDGRLRYFYTIPSFVYHILTNVITNSCNAIASTKDRVGKIDVYCQCCTEEGKKDTIALEVHDNGIGMDESQFEKIFMPFYSHRLVKNSCGLGLFIAKAMARKLNGDIYVKHSEPGKTIMRIELRNLKRGMD